MSPTRPALPPAAATLHATHEAQRTTEAHDEVRRQAVLYGGTRFAHPPDQPPQAGPGSPQARKRRARLPQPRKTRGGEWQEAEHGHGPADDKKHAVVGGRGEGGADSGGEGGHSHSGQGGHEEKRAKLPGIRRVAATPVRPRAGGALPLPSARTTDPEYADAVRAAFCEALLVLRDDRSASRVVGAAELQLDRLDAARMCQSLRSPEGMGTLRQRLVDASKGPRGRNDPFNLLLPLILLIAERPRTTTREHESHNVLTLLRGATLARGARSP